MKRALILVASFLLAAGLAAPGCSDDDSSAGGEFSCNDGRDNDGDGFTDCNDSDCSSDPSCQGQSETDCTNNVDDDNDGQTDCNDSDCASNAACQGMNETDCTNNVDDDNDGFTDCDDPNCSTNPACTGPTTETNCTNLIDDDNDTYTDCEDADCATNPACTGPTTETNCTDQIDNDSDGQTDCADSDCANNTACQGNGEIGDACTTAGQCTPPAGLTAECLTSLLILTFQNGYCSASGCDPQDSSSCGSGSICVGVQGFGYCLKSCTDASQCRQSDGYDCYDPMDLAGTTVCAPPIGGFP